MAVKKGRKKKKKMDAAVAELMAGPKKGEVRRPELTVSCCYTHPRRPPHRLVPQVAPVWVKSSPILSMDDKVRCEHVSTASVWSPKACNT